MSWNDSTSRPCLVHRPIFRLSKVLRLWEFPHNLQQYDANLGQFRWLLRVEDPGGG